MNMQHTAEMATIYDQNFQWLDWLYRAEIAHCEHEEWVDESCAGPESGDVAGYCPRCGYAMSVTLY